MPSPKSRRRKTHCKAAMASKTCDGGRFREGPEDASQARFRLDSALTRLETALNLVDHVDPALAADQTVVAVASTQRFQRVTDLHGTILMLRKAVTRGRNWSQKWQMGLIPPAD